MGNYEINRIGENVENKAFNPGKEDKVFGSVSSKAIADELSKAGYKVDKKKIKIDESLSSLGTHIIKVELHPKVMVDLKIKLEK